MDAQAIQTLATILRNTKRAKLVVYKGIDLSLNYYPKLDVRPYIDIDICVEHKHYSYVKKRIAKHPGFFLVHHENRWGRIIHGHAVFVVPKSGLFIELHISKNPRNIFEYLLSIEYPSFFHGLRKIKIGKQCYYSLARAEYLAVVVRQFLKKISLGNVLYTHQSFGVLFNDFAFILAQMNEKDWQRQGVLLLDNTIFMRFHDYFAKRVWYLFFRLMQERNTISIPEQQLCQIRNMLCQKTVQIMDEAVRDILKGKKINLQQLLEKPNIFLLLCRVLLSRIAALFFKSRQPIGVY